MIQYAKTRGLTTLVLNTNGTRFTGEVAEWVMESGRNAVPLARRGGMWSAPISLRQC